MKGMKGMKLEDELRNEALARIRTLIDRIGLNPKVEGYFAEGRVYYSYLTAGGLIGCIDTIEYDPRYSAALRAFESQFRGHLVYHAIETRSALGTMLSLLFVGPDEEEWEGQRLHGNDIFCYVANVEDPDWSEFGYITVEEFGDSGALVRTA